MAFPWHLNRRGKPLIRLKGRLDGETIIEAVCSGTNSMRKFAPEQVSLRPHVLLLSP